MDKIAKTKKRGRRRPNYEAVRWVINDTGIDVGTPPYGLIVFSDHWR